METCAPFKVGADRFGDITDRKAGFEIPVVAAMSGMVSFMVMSVIHEDHLALQAIKRFILPSLLTDPGVPQRFRQ